jgi:hypothetical protein
MDDLNPTGYPQVCFLLLQAWEGGYARDYRDPARTRSPRRRNNRGDGEGCGKKGRLADELQRAVSAHLSANGGAVCGVSRVAVVGSQADKKRPVDLAETMEENARHRIRIPRMIASLAFQRCRQFCADQSTQKPQGSTRDTAQALNYSIRTTYFLQISIGLNKSYDLLWEQMLGSSFHRSGVNRDNSIPCSPQRIPC